MLSSSAFSRSGGKMSASSAEPSWARSPLTPATGSPTWASPSASPTIPVADMLHDWTRSLDRRARRGATGRPATQANHLPVLLPDALSVRPLDDAGGAGPPRGRPDSGPSSARRPRARRRPTGAADLFVPRRGSRVTSWVGRHLRAPLARVHRTRACLAGRAPRRRGARSRALARVPPRR